MYNKQSSFSNNSDPDYTKSKYNEAANQLFRIGELWQECHQHRLDGNLVKWNIILDSVWMELYADSSEGDKGKIVKLNKLYIKYLNKRVILYQVLLEKEMLLRKLQNEQGKGTSYKDPDEDMM